MQRPLGVAIRRVNAVLQIGPLPNLTIRVLRIPYGATYYEL